jgi:Na+/alanine symporter
MPYGYYVLVRFISMVAFAFFAYEAYRHKNQRDLIIFIVLVLLFQPFEKIALGRVLWNIVDVVVAVYLIFNVIESRKA